MAAKNLFDLSEKTAIVTGGYTGLGLQISEAFVEQGANLVICARNEGKCKEAAEKLAKLRPGAKVLAVRCDISQEEDVDRLVQTTLESFEKIDILVNNAGITWGKKAEEMKLEEWEKVLRVNLSGTFLCTQKVGNEMIKQGRGKIINVSSVTAIKASPFMDAIGYVTSKGGIISFSKDLAVKWAPFGIFINTNRTWFLWFIYDRGLFPVREQKRKCFRSNTNGENRRK
ncbi:MAG: SDR family NAD(P)-dependent oxidoreductase [Thermincola sp.]|nr:SDR family NAD(P)-dependent oxidoreductase [Thermincola sp.]